MARLLSLTVLVILAACGGAASESPSGSSDSSAAASGGPSASPAASEAAPATLTLEGGVVADGPGESVSQAIANADGQPDLVNGILLRDSTGQVWLCEELTDTTPPDCATPRLLVVNFPPDVADFAPSPRPDNRQEADGVMWYVELQLYGMVEP